MKQLWGSEKRKFEQWLQVELAIIWAKVCGLEVSVADYEAICDSARVDVELIAELESEYDQDMIAFVVAVKGSIKGETEEVTQQLQNEFHKGNTSYDIEDPAMVLMLREAISLIVQELTNLRTVLAARALEHKWTLMIARTHGQFAQPTTFGHLLLVYARAVDRSLVRLLALLGKELAQGRISGAVGNYAEVDPGIEEVALDSIGLAPAEAETQILQRDRHAAVISALAIAAGTIEQMCRTFWEMMRSDVRELEEPRKRNQRGSSAMAWKKNPILTERFMGLPRLVRGHAHAAMENIATPECRDISQSSVERHIFPDATSLVHYMAVKATSLVQNLMVFRERMLGNLNERTLGVWAGQRIQLALMDSGVEYDTAYGYVQACSFFAVDSETHLLEVLSVKPISETDERTAQDILGDGLEACFDARAYVAKGIEHIFKQNFGNEK